MDRTFYAGFRTGRRDGGALVLKILGHHYYRFDPCPSQRLINYSPDGFEWGYPGSGPAQLALALLLDATGDPSKALTYHQAYKGKVIAALDPARPWVLCREEIIAWAQGEAAILEA
jgi:hypothetical protein